MPDRAQDFRPLPAKITAVGAAVSGGRVGVTVVSPTPGEVALSGLPRPVLRDYQYGAAERGRLGAWSRAAARASAAAAVQPAMALQYRQGPGSWRCPARPAAADCPGSSGRRCRPPSRRPRPPGRPGGAHDICSPATAGTTASTRQSPTGSLPTSPAWRSPPRPERSRSRQKGLQRHVLRNVVLALRAAGRSGRERRDPAATARGCPGRSGTGARGRSWRPCGSRR